MRRTSNTVMCNSIIRHGRTARRRVRA
uniref:Uncharacterized protein n=1 Tax=Anguilla anguilla TaxID=7936 RepID=A0A0E9SPV4_ANGAN